MNIKQKQILIVGAGPTGLTLACELLRRGVPCRIIEKRQQPSNHSKALGVSATSLMLFDRLGIAKKLLAAGIKMQDTIFYWKGKRFLHTNYRYLNNTKYPFMLLVHQTVTEKYLNECLENLGGKIERGVELSELSQNENHVNVALMHANGEKELACYEEVIGCDGSQSIVREMIGVQFAGKDYGLQFIYGDFELEGWHGDSSIAHYFMDGSNLLIIIPTPNGIYRIVGLIPGDKGTRAKPTQQELQYYLDRFGPGGITLKNPTQFGSVPIYYRIANKIRVGRVFLAGDAFHLFSPIGGQGMNSGIQDAYNLAWKLAYVKKGRAAHSLLDSYEFERLPLVKSVCENVKNTIEMILRADKENDTLVKMTAPIFSNRDNFRRNFPKNYSGFNYKYQPNNFIQDHLTEYDNNCPTAGEYTNDIEVLHQASELTLIVSLNNKTPNYDFYKNIIQQLTDAYPFIQVRYKNSNSMEKFSLVRPDGYIAYQAKLNELDTFQSYLNKFYQKEAVHVY